MLGASCFAVGARGRWRLIRPSLPRLAEDGALVGGEQRRLVDRVVMLELAPDPVQLDEPARRARLARCNRELRVGRRRRDPVAEGGSCRRLAGWAASPSMNSRPSDRRWKRSSCAARTAMSRARCRRFLPWRNHHSPCQPGRRKAPHQRCRHHGRVRETWSEADGADGGAPHRRNPARRRRAGMLCPPASAALVG